MLYLRHSYIYDMIYNILFRIKHKLYVASGSATFPTPHPPI